MLDLTPATWFSSPPGSDGTILAREEIRRWLQALAASSSRLALQSFGRSTEGRPMDLVLVGEDLSSARVSEIEHEREKAVATLLAGSSPGEWTKPIVLITSGIHATEIGGPQGIPELVHWLVTSEGESARRIRQNLLVLIVPTLNPDGMDLVKRWHDRTVGTPAQGTEPPLLYHRFAGHDNNRDWLYRNLEETRHVMDQIHDVWWPHVTLDQHQMNPYGPRFCLPPYADPWEPNVPPSIIAASSSLGQAVAADMTAGGLAGVTTGRYFDAWEPSRAIQHYRGGVRILAEAASANLAWAASVSQKQLADAPLPQPLAPSTSTPMPWQGGTWRLDDIVRYHVAAAISLLRHASAHPDRWPSLQHHALRGDGRQRLCFTVPHDVRALDRSANERLARVLADSCVAVSRSAHESHLSVNSPVGALAAAVLLPKRYPAGQDSNPYDVTTHHLPLAMGAVIGVADEHDNPRPTTVCDADGRYLVFDARCHEVPNVLEEALADAPPAAWKILSRQLVDGRRIEPGSWIVDGDAIPEASRYRAMTSGALACVPAQTVEVSRRDVVMLDVASTPSTDHGWTRWWLQARSIPFLEADVSMIARLAAAAPSTTAVIADVGNGHLDKAAVGAAVRLIAEGGTVIAFGGAGRELACRLSTSVTSSSAADDRQMRTSGALLRLRPDTASPIGLGLDTALPMMFERDGIFSVKPGTGDVRVLGRIAARDTLISGWMPDVAAVSDAPVILQIDHGRGRLLAFSFKPLFRGQMLVTSTLVHNLLYTDWESSACPPSDHEKTLDDSTSVRMC